MYVLRLVRYKTTYQKKYFFLFETENGKYILFIENVIRNKRRCHTQILCQNKEK